MPSLVLSTECTIKDTAAWAVLILSVCSTLITPTSGNDLVLILLGCENKDGRKEWVFFKVENLRACVSSSLVSVVAHNPHPASP